MKDRERGVVWEETIIFLEDETKMVRGACGQLKLLSLSAKVIYSMLSDMSSSSSLPTFGMPPYSPPQYSTCPHSTLF